MQSSELLVLKVYPVKLNTTGCLLKPVPPGLLWFLSVFWMDRGWGGGGRVVRRCWVNFQCRGVLLIWIIVGQGPIALAVGAGGGCLDIFSLVYLFSFLSPSLGDGPI